MRSIIPEPTLPEMHSYVLSYQNTSFLIID